MYIYSCYIENLLALFVRYIISHIFAQRIANAHVVQLCILSHNLLVCAKSIVIYCKCAHVYEIIPSEVDLV